MLYWAIRAELLAQFDNGLRVKALVVITETRQKRDRLDVDFSDRFLREFDDAGAGQIWVERPPAGPAWDGIHDRLRRAAAA